MTFGKQNVFTEKYTTGIRIMILVWCGKQMEIQFVYPKTPNRYTENISRKRSKQFF